MVWNLKSDRYDEIRSIVADLIEDWDISVYPLSVWQLVHRMGIQLIPYSELPEQLRTKVITYWPDAITIYPADFNPARTFILYNENLERERIRFTVAHELAHLILMHPSTGKEQYEHEADIFANYLLAPTPLVLRDSDLDIETIHDDFQVSYSCAWSIKDRAEKRRSFGSKDYTEYELRILAFCSMKGGGCIACA